jgi:magnesium transporter
VSVGDHLQQLQDLARRFVRSVVETPIHHIFGQPQRSGQREPGAPPGTLFIADDAAATQVRLWRIDDTGVEFLDDPDTQDISKTRLKGGRIWLDVAGFADDERIRAIAELFDLHPMVLADLINVDRQTKVNTLDEQALIVLQMLHLESADQRPGLGQLGLLLEDDLLISFRERPEDIFTPVLERLDRPTSRLRKQPLDYLACALLNLAVEASFPVVEALADRIDEAEDQVMVGRGNELLADIHRQRRALITLGRIFWRQRDLMGRLLRDEEIFRRETHLYLRDVYDCTVQLMDMVETTRELAASLVEIHLSISANRSNEIMKTLTIMASIFIPLTFIAGVYGMNFEWMPELTWPWGYPAVLSLMLGVSIGLLLWFRHRGWLGGSNE